MLTLKDLRENGKNKKELSGLTENNGENISENDLYSDNLENNDEYWISRLLCLILMQEHENEKLWENFKNLPEFYS